MPTNLCCKQKNRIMLQNWGFNYKKFGESPIFIPYKPFRVNLLTCTKSIYA
jgi:hypothetical protein